MDQRHRATQNTALMFDQFINFLFYWQKVAGCLLLVVGKKAFTLLFGIEG